jgi:hypothetical protein
MDEKKSLLPVFIICFIGFLLFYFGYKRSLEHKTDFWMELVFLVGDIIKTILMIVGALAMGFVTYGLSKIKVSKIRALFVLIEEAQDWCEQIDSFKDKFIKESEKISDKLSDHEAELVRLSCNSTANHNQIKILREFTGIDAAKAQAEAEKAIEASAKRS